MSEMALRLIAQAEKEKATVLDLGMCGLTTLPEELFNLHLLRELYVCNRYWDWEKRMRIKSKNNGEPNKLDTIPAHIQNLKHFPHQCLGFRRAGHLPCHPPVFSYLQVPVPPYDRDTAAG